MVKTLLQRILPAFLLIITSCGGSKAARYFKQGTTLQESFLSTIPFNFDNGLILIQVSIEDKPYNFLLDTGAPSALSEELADKLGILPVNSQEISDVHGNSNQLKYAKIKDLQIGDVDFINTFAVITDFNKLYPFSCMNIDGIIGSNLLRKAIWDINFKERTLTFTDSEEKLNFPKQFHQDKLYIGTAGIPSLTVWANGEKVYNNTLDLGYDGGIVLPENVIEDQIADNKITHYAEGFGTGPIGAFGSGKSAKFIHSKIKIYEFGDLTLHNQIAYSRNNSPNLVGVGFFKNYRLLLNWDSKRVKFVEISPNTKENYKSFGFDYTYENNKLLVADIVSRSGAADFLKLKDQIISINNIDFSKLTSKNYCEILSKNVSKKSSDSMEISIKRDGKIFHFNLKKEELLN